MYEYLQEKKNKALVSHKPSGQVIQRLTGFEVELSLPVYRKLSGSYAVLAGGPSGKVVSFLLGDVTHNEQIKKTRDYTLTTDHGLISLQHSAITDVLAETSTSDGGDEKYINREFFHNHPIGITEFVTPPEDEAIRSGRRRMSTHIKKIQAAGNSIGNEVGDCMKEITENYYTGIPKEELKGWMGNNYWAIEYALSQYREAVTSRRVNLQATAGILPSSMEELYKQKSDAPEGRYGVLYLLQRIALQDVQEYFEIWDSLPYIQSLKESGDFHSFFGIILLLYTYLLGNSYEHIDHNCTTLKNDVPFLCKLDDMRKIMAKAAPSLPIPDKVTAEVICSMMSRNPHMNPEILCKDIWGNQKVLRVPRLTIIQPDDIQNILTNTGEKPDILSPGHTFAEPDDTEDPTRRGQKGVPLEFRNIYRQVTLDNLCQVCMEIMEEVRQVNEKRSPL